MPTSGQTVYPASASSTSAATPRGRTNYYDGSPDFNGTATILGMVPSSGVYTLTQNLSANVVTIRSGVRVKTQGYVIICKSLVIENGGFLSFNGNDAVGTTGGASLLAANAGHLGCALGGGGAGVVRSTVGSSIGNGGTGSGGGNIGGLGGFGGAGGTANGAAGNSSVALNVSQIRQWRTDTMWALNWRVTPTGNTTTSALVQGGGGGGSGGVQYTGGVGNLTSGAGGAAAGIVAFRAGTLNNKGTIEAVGGNGSDAVLGTATGFAGGGGGGAGGAIHASCDVLSSVGTFSVAGGTGGLGVGGGFQGLPGTPGTFDLFVNGEAY